MYIQWCYKGVAGIDPSTADEILAGGLICQWWRHQHCLPMEDVPWKLTLLNLELHVNSYGAVARTTPFISLTAGTVERDAFLATNVVHPALMTALHFATRGGAEPGYVFRCWVPVALRSAVGIEFVAEEIREINTYRDYSPYHLEGEVLAKVRVPASQIEWYQHYELTAARAPIPNGPPVLNSLFQPPDPVLGIRYET